MEIKSSDVNLIVETLRRAQFKGTQIHNIISTAWGDVISVRRVQKIMKEFEDGERTDFDRQLGSGRLKSQKRVDLIPLISEELATNKRLTCMELALMFDTNHRMIYDIITQDLDLISVRDKWVPHTLTEVNKEARVNCCTELIDTLSRRNIHRNLVVVDEKWFYARPIGCAQSRRSWTGADEAGDRDHTPKRSTMEKKFMAIVAVNFEGLFFFRILERNQTVDSELYTDFLDDAAASFREQTLVNARTAVFWENMRLMHDNARPHVSIHTRNFLQEKNVRLVHQSAYSPDLNLCDRMIFPMLEMKRNKMELPDRNVLSHFLTEALTNLSLDSMRQQAVKLSDHCRKVVAAHGDYVL